MTGLRRGLGTDLALNCVGPRCLAVAGSAG